MSTPDAARAQSEAKAGQYSMDSFAIQTILLQVKEEIYMVAYTSSAGWECSCPFFHDHQVCAHALAVQRLFPSLPTLPLGGNEKAGTQS